MHKFRHSDPEYFKFTKFKNTLGKKKQNVINIILHLEGGAQVYIMINQKFETIILKVA